MKFIYTSFLVLLSIYSAKAQWNSDTNVRNPICTAPSTQYEEQIASDGNQGAYIVWSDLRSSPGNIYGQRIDSGGNIQWMLNGLHIGDSTQLGSLSPAIAADNNGGIYLTYEHDVFGGAGNIELDRIGSSGTSVWGGPVAIDLLNDDRIPQITSDGHGGAIINWYSYVGTGPHVFLQWVDNNGRIRLPANGLQITTVNTAHYGSSVVTDKKFNAFVLFSDNDTLRLVKVDSSGNFTWGQSGKKLSTTFYNGDGGSPYYCLTPDNNGGVIVGWADNNSNNTLYAQRVDKNGNFLWGAAGTILDSSSAIAVNHINLIPVSDGNNGTYFVFGSTRTYIQHLTPDGIASWATAEEVSASQGQSNAAATADGNGGAIVSWNDPRTGSSEYAQQFDSSGNEEWQANGAPILTDASDVSALSAKILSLNNGSAIEAMSVDVNTTLDIYAAKFVGITKPTGINHIKNNADLSIYPNPASDVFYIKNNSAIRLGATLQLFNSLGKLVNEQQVNLSSQGQQQINLSAKAKGIYFLKLLTASGVQSNFTLVIE